MTVATKIVVKHKCPCGRADTRDVRKVRRSLLLQLAVVGTKSRLRAKSITIPCCDRCAKNINTREGHLLLTAVREAIEVEALDLTLKEKTNG